MAARVCAHCGLNANVLEGQEQQPTTGGGEGPTLAVSSNNDLLHLATCYQRQHALVRHGNLQQAATDPCYGMQAQALTKEGNALLLHLATCQVRQHALAENGKTPGARTPTLRASRETRDESDGRHHFENDFQYRQERSSSPLFR